MKKNYRKFAGVLTALCISTVWTAGCTKYEEIDMSQVKETTAQEGSSLEETQQLPAEPASAEETGEGAAPGISALEAPMAQASAPNFTDVSDTVYIRGSQVRLRTSPTTASTNNISAVLNNGAALSRTGDSDDWCRVNYQGATLYVSKAFVTTQNPAGTSAGAGTGNSGSGTVNQMTAAASTGSAGAGNAMTRCFKRKPPSG